MAVAKAGVNEVKYPSQISQGYFQYFWPMGRVNTPVLSAAAKAALEEGLRTDKAHCFRMRCQAILLKSTGRGSKEVGEITAMDYQSVDGWVKRYKAEGLAGLRTRPGRGRKPLLCPEVDTDSVVAAVKEHRQRIQTAKAEWEQESEKSVGLSTFKSFLKALAADTNA